MEFSDYELTGNLQLKYDLGKYHIQKSRIRPYVTIIHFHGDDSTKNNDDTLLYS